MEATYTVTRRGPGGEPREIRCAVHPDCDWRMQANGPKKDDDLIFQVQFRKHLEDSKTPTRQAFGQLRRRGR